jgi:hypothetical protein
MRRGGAVLVFFALLQSCGADMDLLDVDVVTDYAPVGEFTVVRTEAELVDEFDNRVPWRTALHDAGDEDYFAGVHVATLPLKPERALITVTLLAPGDAVVARATVRLPVDRPARITVTISRSCAEVHCPLGDDGAARRCVGGRCVDARCTPETPSTCAGEACAADADCDGASACAQGRCVSGYCLVEARDDRCPAGERCSVIDGCVPVAPGQCRDDVDCGAPPNATAVCLGGSCSLTCATGYADCDASASNGCEIDTGSDSAHCGACFMSCPVPPGAVNATCVAGACRPVCQLGWMDCNGNFADGCENPLTSTSHCGACGRTCISGDGCCDRRCVSLNTDSDCGRCGRACTSGDYCSGSRCVM